MPLSTPNKNERRKEFLSRCMDSETMNREYPKADQRYAVCVSQFEKDKKEKK